MTDQQTVERVTYRVEGRFAADSPWIPWAGCSFGTAEEAFDLRDAIANGRPVDLTRVVRVTTTTQVVAYPVPNQHSR